MNGRYIYNESLYKKLLDEKIVEISRTFFGKEYWGNKKNHGVIVAYDFIPVNKELKLLEVNTNVGIFKEYIPYFDFLALNKFCQKNKFNKVIGVVNEHWYNRGWGGSDTPSSTPSKDFMRLLENMLSSSGIKFELFPAPRHPEPIPEIDTDEKTFVLRFSFDPESKIDELASDKSLFIDHIKKIGLSSLLPLSGDNLLNEKYGNSTFPDIVLKNPQLDNKRGVEFWKISEDKTKEFFKKRGIVSRLPQELLGDKRFFHLEKFIISDTLGKLDQYNLEVRGLGLVTNDDVVLLNREPFIDAKRYNLNSDGSLQQIDSHGTSFVEDTMVELEDGREKKIQDVVSGDKVKSYDIEDIDKNTAWRDWILMNWEGMDSLKSVAANVKDVVHKKTLGYITFNGKYKVTKSASVCHADKNWKWQFKSASDIKIGDTLLLSGNEVVEVSSIEVSDDIVNTYGIDIEGYDNYFGDRLLAHNIGVGAWCFVAGTKIAMSDGSEKNIEDVELDDEVMSWDEMSNEIKSSKVIGTKQPIHDDMVVIRFSNDVVNENTFDHPYYIKGKGWCSHSPQLTKERYDMDAELLEVGDVCYQRKLDGELEEVEVSFIKENVKEVQTYIIELDNFKTFFANGILTHNKDGSTTYGYTMCGRQNCFLPDQLINMADDSYKNIADVEVGDMVKGWDEATDTVKNSAVHDIQVKSHDDVYELHLENGKVLKPTGNHPFLTKDKGWTTIDGHDPNHAGGSGRLEVGDHVHDINKDWIKVENITPVDGDHPTYNFIDMEHGTIIADDIITHNSTWRNTISYLNVQTTSGGVGDKGNDIATRQNPSGASTPSYIWNMGGYPSPKNWISYFNQNTTSGNSSDRGDLYSGGQLGMGYSEMPDTAANFQGAPYCYFIGGQNSGFRDNIQYINGTTTSGNSADAGDVGFGMSQGGASAGTQYGYTLGGYTASSGPSGINIMWRTDATSTNSGFAATDRGDLLFVGRAFPGGMLAGYDSGEIGNMGGGFDGSGYRNNIQYWDAAAATGNAVDKGDLVIARAWTSLTSGDSNFIAMCGHDSCFLPEQLINMADGTLKKIVDIEVGDMVEVWDELSDTVKESPVNEIRIKSHDDVYELHLKDGKVLKPTGNHPIWTWDKGWTTIDGHNPNHAGGSGHLKVGDKVFDKNGSWIEVENIISVEGNHLTYNFINMEHGTIIADDIITHNSSTINNCEYWDITTSAVCAADRGGANASCHGPGTGAGYSNLA